MSKRKKHMIKDINSCNLCYSKRTTQCTFLAYNNSELSCNLKFKVDPKLPEDRVVFRPAECCELEKYR